MQVRQNKDKPKGVRFMHGGSATPVGDLQENDRLVEGGHFRLMAVLMAVRFCDHAADSDGW